MNYGKLVERHERAYERYVGVIMSERGNIPLLV